MRCSILSLVLSSKYKATLIRNKYTPVSKKNKLKIQGTHLYGIFILRKLYASLLFPFLLLQLLSGERVAVVVSGQQAEVPIFLRVKVEPRQLWQQNRWFSTTGRYLVSVLQDTVDRHLLLTWRTTGGLRGGRGRCGGRGGRG